ncbi:MAG: oxaloacetate decarboxylase [Hyphomicrobiaceae bacterium]
MTHPAKRLRQMLKAGEVIEAPGAWDPLTARVLERCGYRCLMVGGWITGASQAITEPLLTMTEQVDVAGAVARNVSVPVIADGHTGYGDPVHVMRAIREYERAGIAAIHIEDQLFPKRAHYHKNVKHTIPIDEMVEKIKYAVKSRTNPDFVIIGRTDAHDAVGGGIQETIARMRAYRDAGADALLPFPSPGDNPRDYDLKAARALRDAVPDIPLIWLAGETGSAQEPTLEELRAAGYQIVMYPLSFLFAAVEGVSNLASKLKRDQKILIPNSAEIQETVQDVIGLNDMFRIEEATTERRQS